MARFFSECDILQSSCVLCHLGLCLKEFSGTHLCFALKYIMAVDPFPPRGMVLGVLPVDVLGGLSDGCMDGFVLLHGVCW